MSTLVLSIPLAACEQADPVDQVAGPAFAPGTPSDVSCTGTAIQGRKTVQVTVNRTKKAGGTEAAAGVVVTLISREDGPQCYAIAGTDGVTRFTNVAQGAEIFVSVRDEVNEYVANLETIPPELPADPEDLLIFDDAPSFLDHRLVPLLLSGPACTNATPLSWANWSANYATPCVVPGPGLDLAVTLQGGASTTTLKLLDPNGGPLRHAVVAALSPWDPSAQDQAAACAQAKWIPDCANDYLSSGPALIQSVDLTADDGSIRLGHVNTSPIVLEAITVKDSLTFFATIEEGIGGTADVQMAPGMCTIAQVLDAQDSSVPNVDIRYTEHSVGMKWDNAEPTPVNSALVVRAEVHAASAGGTGRYDLSWLVKGSKASRSVRADFTIPASPVKVCPKMTWSGNGLSKVGYTGYCAKSADQDSVAGTERIAFTLYFVVTKLPELADAFYQVSTVGDGIDPSKSGNTRAAISFNGEPDPIREDDTLNRTSCPVPVNNDGRFGTFRLGSNDGRFGTF